jgi:hypothetical protein
MPVVAFDPRRPDLRPRDWQKPFEFLHIVEIDQNDPDRLPINAARNSLMKQ